MVMNALVRLYYCTFLLVLTVVVGIPAAAQRAIDTDSVLTAKLYPLLHRLQQNPEISRVVSKDARLKKIWKLQRSRSRHAQQECADAACVADAVKWTETEVAAAGDALIRLYARKKALQQTVARLRKENCYPLYENLPDSSYLRKAWNDAANGINYIFDVYIKGKRPQYGAIDSIGFKKGDVQFFEQLRAQLQNVRQEPGYKTFYDHSLQFALYVLQLNGRDEAARYEPLAGGMNQSPFRKIPHTDFSKYPYSMILIPGRGPEQEGVALHPAAAARCREGVMRYRAGLAPFMVVSGGNVHPFKTPYNEAEEMKKYMVAQLGVPEDAIFIEPHARHTTTNLRNAARMVYRFGMPAGKPLLIVTDKAQSSYIVQRMHKIALRDLQYLPYGKVEKRAEEETVFYLVRDVLQPNPFDPLDP